MRWLDKVPDKETHITYICFNTKATFVTVKSSEDFICLPKLSVFKELIPWY